MIIKINIFIKKKAYNIYKHSNNVNNYLKIFNIWVKYSTINPYEIKIGYNYIINIKLTKQIKQILNYFKKF